ncbi:MerR family transcriptional regulator [Pseudactinotalea sp.]|uniref:MerR family transcriptional regulator n=1 Tax=Pseudactinotalea sp. TaxID=1926260 RepID=UPI003B3A7D7C
MTTTFTPAETAEATGLTIDTLRYYEREGLVGPISRATSGHRTYSDGDVAWIGLLTCLRDAGLGIDHLREFTRLLRDMATVEDRVGFLKQRREELLAQTEAIRAAVDVLDEKIAYYSTPR